MSVKIIEQVLFMMTNIPETNIVPKAKNGCWFVSGPKREGFSKVKYYEYHIEYKDEKDYEQNFTKYNEDFVSGLKQLGLSEEKISKIPVKIICNKYNDKTPTTFREWRKNKVITIFSKKGKAMSTNNESDKELITVCCPYCNEKQFSFSENTINKTQSIQFVCPECASRIDISKTHEGNLFIQCL